MSRRHDDAGLLTALRDARPDDVSRAEAEKASVRVLARLVVLEAGRLADTVEPARVARRFPTRAIAAAVLLLGCLSMPFGSVDPARPGGDAGFASDGRVADGRPAWIEAALSGDTLARARARVGGASKRAELLEQAERGGIRGRDALALLSSWGAPRGADEIRRAQALAHDSDVGPVAIQWLGTDLGPGGARALGQLLISPPDAPPDALPDAERQIVAALERVAKRGRREAASLALLEGVAAGRAEATAAALRIGGAQKLERVLSALAEEASAQLAGDATVIAAVEGGSSTLRARLTRLAERGDAMALRLGAGARLPALVPLLAVRAVDGTEAEAVESVQLLAAYDTPDAWVTLGRAVRGPAGALAQEALARLSEDACVELERRARTSARQADAAMICLAYAGSQGVGLLRRLAARPALSSAALAALEVSPDVEASRILAVLSHRSALLHDAVDALGTRLRRGDETAGTALLALARGRHARAVFRTLSSCGDVGVVWLQRACEDPNLERQARHTLARLRVDQSAGDGARPRVQVKVPSRLKRAGAL